MKLLMFNISAFVLLKGVNQRTEEGRMSKKSFKFIFFFFWAVDPFNAEVTANTFQAVLCYEVVRGC